MRIQEQAIHIHTMISLENHVTISYSVRRSGRHRKGKTFQFHSAGKRNIPWRGMDCVIISVICRISNSLAMIKEPAKSICCAFNLDPDTREGETVTSWTVSIQASNPNEVVVPAQERGLKIISISAFILSRRRRWKVAGLYCLPDSDPTFHSTPTHPRAVVTLKTS